MKINLLSAAIVAVAYLLPVHCEAQTPTQAQLDAIEKILAPQRQKVLAVLEADKTGQFAQYKADVDNIQKQADPAKVKSLVAALEAKHLAFIRKAYADAKINNAQLKQEVAKVLGKIQFTLGEFADIQIEFNSPVVAPPVKFDVTMNCPFEVQDVNENNNGIGACYTTANDCGMNVQAISEIASGCRGKADVGGKAELNFGTFSKMTVATQTDIAYDMYVFSVGGYAQANLKYGIRFRSSNGLDKEVMTKELVALAPAIWVNIVHGESANFLSTATFTGSFPAGTTVTAQAHTEAFALDLALGFSLAYVYTTNIDSIRITGSN
ncbi:MAG: hypothetical protein IT258_17495 [Saprospiraceae bacterium]|nr:hypothetical protein [Saprospiraceae bacterium]